MELLQGVALIPPWVTNVYRSRNKPDPIAMNFRLPAPISDATWNMMSEDQQENILFESYLFYKASYRNYQKLYAQQNGNSATFEFFLNLHGKDILTQMIARKVGYLEDKVIDRKNRKMDAENAKILQDTNEAMVLSRQEKIISDFNVMTGNLIY